MATHFGGARARTPMTAAVISAAPRSRPSELRRPRISASTRAHRSRPHDGTEQDTVKAGIAHRGSWRATSGRSAQTALGEGQEDRGAQEDDVQWRARARCSEVPARNAPKKFSWSASFAFLALGHRRELAMTTM